MGCLKGLEHFQKKCELLKQEARDKTEPVCSPRGLSGQRIKHCQAPKEKRFARSAEKLSAPLSPVGHGGVVRTNCQITHTQIHTDTLALTRSFARQPSKHKSHSVT